jgi:hypothetical protein
MIAIGRNAFLIMTLRACHKREKRKSHGDRPSLPDLKRASFCMYVSAFVFSCRFRSLLALHVLEATPFNHPFVRSMLAPVIMSLMAKREPPNATKDKKKKSWQFIGKNCPRPGFE